jgi:hypothetical protein
VPNRKGYGKVGKRKAAFQLSHSHDYYEIHSVMGYGFKGQVQYPAIHVMIRQLLETEPVIRTFNVDTSTTHKIAATKAA